MLMDMIEEYARHVGHADLIRERSSGSSARIRRTDNIAGTAEPRSAQ